MMDFLSRAGALISARDEAQFDAGQEILKLLQDPFSSQVTYPTSLIIV
jgi:hypothetical protein